MQTSKLTNLFFFSSSSSANHPPAPIVTGTPTTLSSGFFTAELRWTQPDDSFVREYHLTLAYVGPCPEGVEEGERNVTTISGLMRTHVMEGLYPNAEYSGTLVAINDRGSSNVTSFTFTTPRTGKFSAYRLMIM